MGTGARDTGHRWRVHNAAVGVAIAALLASMYGCSKNDVELVEVTGTVMMDGQPLPEATVRFLPIVEGNEPARPSSAVTDENGYFELGYSTTKMGARPGKYRVYISTFRNPEPDLPGKPETVPQVYNKATELTQEVPHEDIEVSFVLDSSAGEVVQPRF